MNRYVYRDIDKDPERTKPVRKPSWHDLEWLGNGFRIGAWDLYVSRGRFLAYHLIVNKQGAHIVRWEL